MNVSLYALLSLLQGLGFGGELLQQTGNGPGFRDGREGCPERGGKFREAVNRHKTIELLLSEAAHDDGPPHL